MHSVNRLPTPISPRPPSSRPPPSPLSTHSQTMSLKMTEQMAYEHLARYGPYHPDNLNRKVDLSLPKPVESPAPPAQFTKNERAQGMWGHRLMAEMPYGTQETTTRIKAYISPKVGMKGGWNTQAERGVSTMKSGIYATSYRIPTFTQQSAMQKGV